MSLPKPKTHHRIPSDPYSPAIPPRNPLFSTTATTSKPLRKPTPTHKSGKSNSTLQIPTLPQKAVRASEKPIELRLSSSTATLIHHHIPPYTPPAEKRNCAWRNKTRLTATLVALSLAILLAIIIPLAILLPQKLIKPLPINILVPMFAAPGTGEWERLYDAIIAHPSTLFTVIVKPPGTSIWPAGEYIKHIERLNVWDNMRTLGYIDVARGETDITTVNEKIDTYAGWKDVSEKLGIRGMYFDHTPYRDQGGAGEYLGNVTEAVRDAGGFGDAPMVVVNPGRVPDEGLGKGMADATVVFEGVYGDLPEWEVLRGTVEKVDGGREGVAMLVHSVPKTVGKSGLRDIVNKVRRDVEWVYVTDRTEDVYNGLGKGWEEWLDVIW